MVTISYTAHSFPQWSRRTSALVLSALVLAATTAIVLLTVVKTSGSSHSTAPGVVHVQKPGAAGQTGSNTCELRSKQAPTRC